MLPGVDKRTGRSSISGHGFPQEIDRLVTRRAAELSSTASNSSDAPVTFSAHADARPHSNPEISCTEIASVLQHRICQRDERIVQPAFGIMIAGLLSLTPGLSKIYARCNSSSIRSYLSALCFVSTAMFVVVPKCRFLQVGRISNVAQFGQAPTLATVIGGLGVGAVAIVSACMSSRRGLNINAAKPSVSTGVSIQSLRKCTSCVSDDENAAQPSLVCLHGVGRQDTTPAIDSNPTCSYVSNCDRNVLSSRLI